MTLLDKLDRLENLATDKKEERARPLNKDTSGASEQRMAAVSRPDGMPRGADTTFQPELVRPEAAVPRPVAKDAVPQASAAASSRTKTAMTPGASEAAAAFSRADASAMSAPAETSGSEQAASKRPGPASARPSEADVRQYTIQVPAVRLTATCREVLGVFREHAGAPCAVVTGEDGVPAGLLMRDAFYRRLAGRFAAELFYDRAASLFADTEAMRFEGSGSPEELIQQALQRPEAQFYDCILILEQGKLSGVMTVKDMMLLSGRLQEIAQRQRDEAVADSYSHISGIEAALLETASAAGTTQEECRRMEHWISSGSKRLTEVKTSYLRVDQRMRTQQEQVSRLLEDVEQISSMTGEIGGIAERSGLLAINASIEAAHAGEHGRGFQVVAGEVRMLAQQTRQLSAAVSVLLEHIVQLARETSELTEAGVAEVGGSAKDVEQAEAVFADLQVAVQTVEQSGSRASRLARESAERAEDVKHKLQVMTGDTSYER